MKILLYFLTAVMASFLIVSCVNRKAIVVGGDGQICSGALYGTLTRVGSGAVKTNQEITWQVNVIQTDVRGEACVGDAIVLVRQGHANTPLVNGVGSYTVTYSGDSISGFREVVNVETVSSPPVTKLIASAPFDIEGSPTGPLSCDLNLSAVKTTDIATNEQGLFVNPQPISLDLQVDAGLRITKIRHAYNDGTQTVYADLPSFPAVSAGNNSYTVSTRHPYQHLFSVEVQDPNNETRTGTCSQQIALLPPAPPCNASATLANGNVQVQVETRSDIIAITVNGVSVNASTGYAEFPAGGLGNQTANVEIFGPFAVSRTCTANYNVPAPSCTLSARKDGAALSAVAPGENFALIVNKNASVQSQQTVGPNVNASTATITATAPNTEGDITYTTTVFGPSGSSDSCSTTVSVGCNDNLLTTAENLNVIEIDYPQDICHNSVCGPPDGVQTNPHPGDIRTGGNPDLGNLAGGDIIKISDISGKLFFRVRHSGDPEGNIVNCPDRAFVQFTNASGQVVGTPEYPIYSETPFSSHSVPGGLIPLAEFIDGVEVPEGAVQAWFSHPDGAYWDNPGSTSDAPRTPWQGQHTGGCHFTAKIYGCR